MKTVLIIAGIIVFLVYGFVLYCCIRVGKESDEQYNKLKEGKEQEDDRSRVCKQDDDLYDELYFDNSQY